jgi:hypothetical protein
MVRRLVISEDYFDELFNDKRVFIWEGRLGIGRGGLIFESEEVGREFLVDVELIYYAPLRNVLVVDLFKEGYVDHQDMVIKLKPKYPTVNINSEMTVIRFKPIN